MAQLREEVGQGLLYHRYVEALKRYGDSSPESPSPGHEIRHCRNCGVKAMFRLDPEGMWYECLHCGHYD